MSLVQSDIIILTDEMLAGKKPYHFVGTLAVGCWEMKPLKEKKDYQPVLKHVHQSNVHLKGFPERAKKAEPQNKFS